MIGGDSINEISKLDQKSAEAYITRKRDLVGWRRPPTGRRRSVGAVKKEQRTHIRPVAGDRRTSTTHTDHPIPTGTTQ